MKDIAQHAGFVALKRNVLTDDYVTLYDGKVAGLDTDGGRWSLVCEIRRRRHLPPHQDTT